MSILIKGKKIPKNCDFCILKDVCDFSVPFTKRPSDCPLIEVPEPSDIRPIKGFDMSRGVLDMQTGIFYPAEEED